MRRTGLGLIWAQSSSGVIGRDGGIPWQLPEDLARFKDITMGHTVVMGRRTWESLPAPVRPLPGRRNVVLTRQADYMAHGATVVTDLEDALAEDGGQERSDSGMDPDCWVIGGSEIYHLALPLATRCEVTEVEIDLRLEDDDALAPMLDGSWVGTSGPWQDSRSGLRYRFHTYQRA
ncbi:dihydrofolate reductase [Mycolicibacterium litorale]|nr:dihydrofolate reductase [Mycolicibacterium litorale]